MTKLFISLISGSIPDRFDSPTIETTFVFEESFEDKSSRSKEKSSLTFTYLILNLYFSATICQGIIFAWCSISDKIISSPSLMNLFAIELAKKLRASVVPFVKIISSDSVAFKKD